MQYLSFSFRFTTPTPPSRISFLQSQFADFQISSLWRVRKGKGWRGKKSQIIQGKIPYIEIKESHVLKKKTLVYSNKIICLQLLNFLNNDLVHQDQLHHGHSFVPDKTSLSPFMVWNMQLFCIPQRSELLLSLGCFIAQQQ